jgi:hypothetical protein
MLSKSNFKTFLCGFFRAGFLYTLVSKHQQRWVVFMIVAPLPMFPTCMGAKALSTLGAVLAPHLLSNLQELIVRYCWEGQTYTQIAKTTGYDND